MFSQLFNFNKTFSSLKERNFRMYFLGQVISLTGSWMQAIALSWLAYNISGSETVLGIVLALSTLPLLFFGLFGGYISQKFSVHKIVIWTQALNGVVPIGIAALIYLDKLSIEVLYFSALWLGLMRVFDHPARHTIVQMMVSKENLNNALSLMSSSASLARIVGPVLAGFVMTIYGPAICFLANGLSFFAQVFMFLNMKTKEFHIKDEHMETSFSESIKGILQNRVAVRYLVLSCVIGVLVYNFQAIFPIYSKTIFSGNVMLFSYMMSTFSVGAILGGLYSAQFSKISSTQVMRFGLALSFCFFLLGFVENLPLFMFIVLFLGFFAIRFSSSLNFKLRSVSDTKYLGMTFALWSMGSFGMTTFGSLFVGVVSEYYGVQEWMLICALGIGMSSYFLLRK